jgi:hypothetical protein
MRPVLKMDGGVHGYAAIQRPGIWVGTLLRGEIDKAQAVS